MAEAKQREDEKRSERRKHCDPLSMTLSDYRHRHNQNSRLQQMCRTQPESLQCASVDTFKKRTDYILFEKSGIF